MRLPPTQIEALRNRLKEARLYDERNEPLIVDAVKLQVMIERAEKELSHQQYLLHQIGSRQQEKVSINPLVDAVTRLIERHARVLWYLGLGNKKQADTDIQEETELLKDIMNL